MTDYGPLNYGKLTLHLSCGCELDRGVVGIWSAEKLVPWRKDGKFGAAKCRHGRRRVKWYQWATTGETQSIP